MQCWLNSLSVRNSPKMSFKKMLLKIKFCLLTAGNACNFAAFVVYYI